MSQRSMTERQDTTKEPVGFRGGSTARSGVLDSRLTLGYGDAPESWRVMNHEKDVSTQQSAAQEEARVSGPDADAQWTEDPRSASAQGAPASVGLNPEPHERPARLRRRADFQMTYRQGVRASGRWLVLFARVRTEGDPEVGRFGITVSRKVGGAVTRNRCKRRIRELIRLHGHVVGGEPALDVVINARRGCEDASWSELVREFERCLRTVRSRLASPSERSGGTRGGSRPSSRPRAASTPPAPSTLSRPSGGTGSSGEDGSA